jgi:hypothetical protein
MSTIKYGGIGSASSDIGFHKVSVAVPKDLAGISLSWIVGARVGHNNGIRVTGFIACGLFHRLTFFVIVRLTVNRPMPLIGFVFKAYT